MKRSIAPLLAAVSLAVAGSAHAASISFNLADTDSSSAGALTFITGFPYGVESSSNWTQGEANTSNLIDDSGAATTLDFAMAAFTLSTGGDIPNFTTFRYGDSHFPGAASDSWSLSEIPYAQYKIIVYATGSATLVQGDISVGGTTYYYAQNRGNVAFTEITDTSAAGTPVFGNYAVFGSDTTPLTGANQTISWSATGQAGAAILTGFQVVQVPEPGSLALLGLGGLLITRRRR